MSEKSENARIDLYINTKGAEATLKGLGDDARKLRNELRNLSPTTEEFRQKAVKLDEVKGRINEVEASAKKTRNTFLSWKDMFMAGGVMGLALTVFTALKAKVSEFFTGNLKLTDSLADMKKATGMTTAEVKKLSGELNKINTRTSSEDLRKMATAAGQLGVAKGDILAFTTSIDKLNVALGDEFPDPETITKEIGGLRNIFTDMKSDRIDEDMLNIGNAINELGANGAATGGVIADFSNRIGGVGIQLGLTSGQVLGMSAAMQELNINAERGSTATTKILQKMAGDTKTFSKIAGMDVQVFTDMVNNDLYGAFTKVLEGAHKSGDSATLLAKILSDLGVEGAGASELVAKLGSNIGLMNEKVDLASDSLKNTNSIMDEFNTKNNTAAANMEKFWKWLGNKFVTSEIADGLTKITRSLAELAETKISEGMQDEMTTVNMLASELMDYNTESQRRKEIYDELLIINPQIVEGIDRESISYNKLRENLAEYNKEQINRIIIQKKQEELDDQNEDTADALERKMKSEIALRKRISELSLMQNKYGEEARSINQESTSFDVKIKKLLELDKSLAAGIVKQREMGVSSTNLTLLTDEYKRAVNDLNKEQDRGNSIIKEKSELMDQLGMNIKKPEVKQAEETKKLVKDADPTGDPDKDDKDAEKRAKLLLEWRELRKKDAMDTLNDNVEFELKNEEQKREWNQKHLAGQVEALEAMSNYKLSAMGKEQEREEQAVYEQYGKLRNMAIEAGLDAAGLQEVRDAQLFEIKEKYRKKEQDAIDADNRKKLEAEKKLFDAKIGLAHAFSSLITATNNLIGKQGAEMSNFQKTLALAQIAIDTGAAIATNVRNAVAASSAGGPAAPFLVATYIATGLASILTAVSSAKAALQDAPTPTAPSFSESTSSGGNSRGGYREYSQGGYTIGFGQPDHTGYRPAGIVHEDEYVVSSPMMEVPWVANTVGMMEALRIGSFAQGGYTSTPTSSFSSPQDSASMAIIGELTKTLQGIQSRLDNPIPVNARLNYDVYQEDLNTLNTIQNDANT